MDMKIIPSVFRGEVDAIPSKSHAHRLFICAALSEKPVNIEISQVSTDIEVTIDCIRAMGAEVTRAGDIYTVNPVWEKLARNPVLFCNESGSTLRFLLPVAAALFESAHFDGAGRLPKRPLSPLKEQMEEKGVSFSGASLPLSLKGVLKSGVYTLAGDISSQFISGLLFALPMLEGDSEIIITGTLESESYINMTLDALEQFGINIQKGKNSFLVRGGQKYRGADKCHVEGDWSNAAFWLAAGAVSGSVKILGLDTSSKQGDRAVLSILSGCGAAVNAEGDLVSVSSAKLSPMNIDASDIPDLVPVLAAVACAAKGKSQIKNVSRLRLKESDRVEAVLTNLRALGGEIKEDGGNLYINGTGYLKGGEVSGFGDHRMVMSAAVAALICREPVIIRGAEAVDKSYKSFFDDFKILGGEAYVI